MKRLTQKTTLTHLSTS